MAITVLHPDNTNAEKITANYENAKNIAFTGTAKKEAFNTAYQDALKQIDTLNKTLDGTAE